MNSWEEFIDDEAAKPYMAQLRKFLREERRDHIVYPAESQVLRAFAETPLHQVRVVILGQDPYFSHPDKRTVGEYVTGPACGLAFAVPPGMPLQRSLRVILEEMAADLGYRGIVSDDLELGDFTSLAPRGDLLLYLHPHRPLQQAEHPLQPLHLWQVQNLPQNH
jgi:uracil-DNA glycosylase